MIRHLIFVILASITVEVTWAQFDFESNISSPVDIPLVLSGTFGELRSNHFHAGIDIKTEQRTGLPVYAIADGTVSRIKIGLWGYGKVLYIAHPNGKTSVYAHLDKFAPKIESYIKNLQYRRESYTVETYPTFGELMVRSGDIIAYSGNTGSSSGPHLHFEIRNSASQNPTNPLAYGLEVEDNIPPVIQKVFIYPLDINASVGGVLDKIQIPIAKGLDGKITGQTTKGYGNIGIGLVLYDQQTMARNKNGIYLIKVEEDGAILFEMTFDEFSFDESKMINDIIDYEHLIINRERILKLFRPNSNLENLDKVVAQKGMIYLSPAESKILNITVKDYQGNETTLKLPLEGMNTPTKPPLNQEVNITIPHEKPSKLDLNPYRIFFPKNTVLETVGINPELTGDTLMLNGKIYPVYKNFTLIYESRDEEALTEQHFIAELLGKRLNPLYLRTRREDNTLIATAKNLGTFCVLKDTVPPKITPKNFKEKQWLSNYRYLSLTISDDLSGIKSYEARVNGKWILMSYEPKTNTITYNFDDDIIQDTQWNLTLEVSDNVGNTTLAEYTFFRK